MLAWLSMPTDSIRRWKSAKKPGHRMSNDLGFSCLPLIFRYFTPDTAGKMRGPIHCFVLLGNITTLILSIPIAFSMTSRNSSITTSRGLWWTDRIRSFDIAFVNEQIICSEALLYCDNIPTVILLTIMLHKLDRPRRVCDYCGDFEVRHGEPGQQSNCFTSRSHLTLFTAIPPCPTLTTNSIIHVLSRL